MVMDWNTEKSLEVKLKKIIRFWIDEYGPNLTNELDLRLAEPRLEKFLKGKIGDFIDFNVDLYFDEDRDVAASCNPVFKIPQ